MKIGIIGAGAIGGWLGVRLARKGHRVSALARGTTLEAIRRDGWKLDIGGETLVAAVQASDRPEQLAQQDILLIALKGPALAALAPTLSPMIGPDTLIVPMMNGVPWWFLMRGGGKIAPASLRSIDPDGAIASALPLDQILGSVVHASVATRVPGHAAHKSGNGVIFGEPGGALTARLEQICALFEDAGFAVTRSQNIRYDIWYKLWGNMTMNPISALTGATCDRILDDPLVADFTLRVMAEAAAIGARIGCRIEERGEDRMQVTRKLGAFKTSMLQDAEAGRPLEIDQLLSAPREIAALLGMETPNMDALTGLARLYGRTQGIYPAD